MQLGPTRTAVKERRAPVPNVGPHLPSHETMPLGLGVLKEALRMILNNYPESMHRVWFYRPALAFRFSFSIIRLLVPRRTREKFVLVREGEERAHFLHPSAASGCAPEVLPPEFGGTGLPLDGDRFLLRAIEFYDETAPLPPRAHGAASRTAPAARRSGEEARRGHGALFQCVASCLKPAARS